MAHVPHLFVPGPWDEGSIELDGSRRHHLERVLRRRDGDPVSYTDGAGTYGEGRLAGGSIRRGPESTVPRLSPLLTLAVAPPTARERQRFLVEKLAELGVAGLVWLSTRHGEGRPPREEKSRAWAAGALEQSRGSWMLEIGADPVTLDELPTPLIVARPGGGPVPDGPDELTVAIGPEGGFDPAEVPAGTGTVDLGPRILRVETAAIAIAARLSIR